jgi:integrase
MSRNQPNHQKPNKGNEVGRQADDFRADGCAVKAEGCCENCISMRRNECLWSPQGSQAGQFGNRDHCRETIRDAKGNRSDEGKMPRQSKGAHLWLEPEERINGKLRRRSTWIIKDGKSKVRTGCAPSDRKGAEQALQEHIAKKYQVSRERGRHPSEILLADVLNIYLADKAPKHTDPSITKGRVLTLAEWWDDKALADVNGASCRAYVSYRTSQHRKASRPDVTGKPPRMVTAAGARRELEDLRAAINHHRQEGLCSEIVGVRLPDKSQPKSDWLTRSEAAALIWSAWRVRDGLTGRPIGRHVARFCLVGLYTGTRHAAICAASFNRAIGRGHIDLDRGVFYRRAQGAQETNKRQPPVRLPARLLAHLERWKRNGYSRHAVVEWNGKPVVSVRKSFAAAVAAAGINRHLTPHVLRHTAATWAMQGGANLWEAAGYLGMSPEVLERVYGHHHPDFQADVAKAISVRRK